MTEEISEASGSVFDDIDLPYHAAAAKVQLSYPVPKEWIEHHPESVHDFVALVDEARKVNISAIATALEEAANAEREACVQASIAVQDECSDDMNRLLGEGKDDRAEVARCRLEGAARVMHRLDARSAKEG